MTDISPASETVVPIPARAPTPLPAPPLARLPSIRPPRHPDLAPGHTRFVCQVAYDGTAFLGWQSQAGGNTIQDAIERRLAQIFGTPVRIHGSGRTDAGVHADAQVFHFDAAWKHSTETLTHAFRTGLPKGIQVFSVATGRANFHARFSARGKRYRYQIYEGFAPPMLARYHCSTGAKRLDVDAMRDAAALLLGVHDFTAFGGRHGSGHDGENPVKDLRRLDVSRQGPRISIVTEASGYLYKMVRRLSGGLMQVGIGRLTPAQLLAYREARVSLAMVPAALACGLVMEKVFYRLPANAHPLFRNVSTTDGDT
ncbi:MAG: tRNA pseudouridine(38-40) synthase TruA [Puniceicoccales bacterium]|jgi:tRNA pseudouridine38-40 synthase|nr:tRNA pseudouridine(38-40) synthase TruA [Puniceicoccales bacterium]